MALLAKLMPEALPIKFEVSIVLDEIMLQEDRASPPQPSRLRVIVYAVVLV